MDHNLEKKAGVIISEEMGFLNKIGSKIKIGADIHQIFENGLLYFEKDEQSPLLLIDLESKDNKLDSIILKFNEYFKIGIKSCWLVIPVLKEIVVYDSIRNPSYYFGLDILKDSNLKIELDLKKVFI